MTTDLLQQIAYFAIPVIFAVTFHEAAHGYVALYFGDETAKNAGRITLNPLKHIDPFGTVILPILLLLSNTGFMFGYAKPVPVNFNALRNPRWNMLWVAAAGPAMNVSLAVVSALLLYVATSTGAGAGADEAIANMLLMSIRLNMLLAVFNMLPLPPLDGSKVVAAFLPGVLARPYLHLARYGMLILLLLLFVVPLLSERAGISFDLLRTLVQQPADYLAQGLMALIRRG